MRTPIPGCITRFVGFSLSACFLLAAACDDGGMVQTDPPVTTVPGADATDGDAGDAGDDQGTVTIITPQPDASGPSICDFPQTQEMTPTSGGRIQAGLCWPAYFGFGTPTEEDTCVRTESGSSSSCETYLTFYRNVESGDYSVWAASALPVQETSHGSIQWSGVQHRINGLPGDTEITVVAGADSSRTIVFRFEGDSVIVTQGE